MTLSLHNVMIGKRLGGISATLMRGQITAICGPNGAGKSTLLSVLAGLLKPDSGCVQIDTVPLCTVPPRRKAQRIGYLPQNGEAAWDVTVRNLVALGRMPHRDAAEGPVLAAMDGLDLRGLAERPMSRLSGGEKARALLARVLAGQPDWILADEPLAALDLAHQLALIDHLRSQADKGTGVVIVLHDLAVARNHADRVLVLEGGDLSADDTHENALGSKVIERVWGVAAQWVGPPGGQALIARPPA